MHALAVLVLVPVILGIFLYRKQLGCGKTTSENQKSQSRTISVSPEELMMDAAAQPITVRVPSNNEQQVIENAVYIPQDNEQQVIQHAVYIPQDHPESLNYKDQCRENAAAPPPLAAALLIHEGDEAKPKAKS